MFPKGKILEIICLCVIFLMKLQTNNAAKEQIFRESLDLFSTQLYAELIEKNPNKNILFSPLSIQTTMAMVGLGAAGDTALEIKKVALSGQSPKDFSNGYNDALKTYQSSSIFHIANKVYVKEDYEIHEEFNASLTQLFSSSVDAIDFLNPTISAKIMNDWVEMKTNGLIKDLIKPSSLNELSRLVLISAIHFNGAWAYPFPENDTREMNFYINEAQTVKAQMMHLNKTLLYYCDLPELGATAVELPYKNTDLAMLIVLPNSRTGLASLEKKLAKLKLSDISAQMDFAAVTIALPKFKAEFQVELSEPLTKMGMHSMFSKEADFSKMLKSPEDLRGTRFIHKTFMEVNEKGTEAGAASGFEVSMDRMPPSSINFTVDRPFYYALKSESGLVLFNGNLKNIS